MPLVGIVMGSASDEPYAKETMDILDKLGISYELNFLSAHRTPEKARDYGMTAKERGLEVIIAGAGMAAHLPGVLASWTTLPIIGIPLPGSDLQGLDALLAIVQMPAGIPVATVAIGRAGARNAAFFAAQILALKYPDIAAAHEEHRAYLELRPTLMIPRYSRPAMARVWEDDARYDKWLRIEIAVCQAWADEGVIPESAMRQIRSASYDLAIFHEAMKETRHDMTAFLQAVYPSVGSAARHLHLGLTTSDVWDTALSMQMVEAVNLLLGEVDLLIRALESKAREHKDTVMIGRTHGVHAEPITFGLKLALWVDEMRRNRDRLERLKGTVGVGKISGAVGTYALVSPQIEERVCRDLGLTPARISNQIIQRDIHAEFSMTLALVGASLEKFATELRGLQRTEILEVEEPFGKGQTGSSAMPHKRNPIICERICGLARVMRGHVVAALEDVALWNERDISHSSVERIIMPDACLALDYCLHLFTGVIEGMTVHRQNMTRNLETTRGLVFSQRVLTRLIESGLDRSVAYAIVQKLSLEAWTQEKDFRKLLLDDPKVTERVPAEELQSLFEYGFYLRHVDEVFRRLGLNNGETGATK